MFKKKNLKKTIAGIGSIAVVVALLLTFLLPSFSISMSSKGNYYSISIGKGVSAYSTDWYEDANLHNGLWYSDIDNPIIIGGLEVSFMKIYTLGGTLRVMELSTYPRAYKDTSPHVYTVDTPFIVVPEDINEYYDSSWMLKGSPSDIEEGEPIYIDTKMYAWKVGDTAVHYAGDSLPGEFPLWIESESLPLPTWVDRKNDVFPFVFGAVKGELVSTTLYEGVYREQTSITWTVIPAELFDTYKTLFTTATSEIRVNKLIKNKDRTVLRIIYDKVITP